MDILEEKSVDAGIVLEGETSFSIFRVSLVVSFLLCSFRLRRLRRVSPESGFFATWNSLQELTAGKPKPLQNESPLKRTATTVLDGAKYMKNSRDFFTFPTFLFPYQKP